MNAAYSNTFATNNEYEVKLSTKKTHNIVCVLLWNPDASFKQFEFLSERSKKTKDQRKIKERPSRGIRSQLTNYSLPS